MFGAPSAFTRMLSLLTVLLLAISTRAESQLLRTGSRLAFPGPTGLTAAGVSNGVRLDWQPVTGSVQYLVYRGVDSTAATERIGVVAGNVVTFTDAGQTTQASYRVVAVATDGRQGSSPIVLYTPPITATMTTLPIGTILSAPATTTTSSTTSTQPKVRKVTGVEKTMLRSGATLKITGSGLADVKGVYFGQGAPGSATNPLLTPVTASDGAVWYQTAGTCAQGGTLILHVPDGSATFVTPDTPIDVYCFPQTPAGVLDRLEQGFVRVAPTWEVVIKGTNLRAATYAVDQRGRKYPLTFVEGSDVGLVRLSWDDHLSFTVGTSVAHGDTLRFTLENALTDPVANGNVTGAVIVLHPPSYRRVTPAWAQPGQKARLDGRGLANGGTPTIKVGSSVAQVLSASDTLVELRIPTSATSGPITLTNPWGTAQDPGPFTTIRGTQHPGFFLVLGQSSITSIVKPATLSRGDTILVRGMHLARLMGICVNYRAPSGALKQEVLQRVDRDMGFQTSNTEMRVVLSENPSQLSGGSVVPYAPAQPVGDDPPSQFACDTYANSTVTF